MPFSTPPTASQIEAMRDAHVAAVAAAYAPYFADPPTLTLCEALEAAKEAHEESIQGINDAMVAAGCGATAP